jgi:NAD(P)-dependent dehydrogenase (short-subunit alcohol dehydrogenase family)
MAKSSRSARGDAEAEDAVIGGITEALAKEVKGLGIKVTAIAPGLAVAPLSPRAKVSQYPNTARPLARGHQVGRRAEPVGHRRRLSPALVASTMNGRRRHDRRARRRLAIRHPDAARRQKQRQCDQGDNDE